MLPYIPIYGEFKIPTYSLIFIVAFMVCALLSMKIAPSHNIDKFDAIASAMYALIGIAIGAKLMFFVSKIPGIVRHRDVALDVIMDDPIGFLSWAFGGLVFYGGLIGAIVGGYRYCWRYRVSFNKLIDLYTPFFPIIHGFGRVGCFLAGCCYGIEYHGPFAVHFPYNEMSPDINLFPRFPVQLLEAGLNFIVGIILFIIAKKCKNIKPGQLLGIYLLYYLVARFFLEMLRGDSVRGNVAGISTSQIISIIIIPFAIFLIRGGLLKIKGRAFPDNVA